MRSIARQSTRLANSTRSRPPARRKHEALARRSFHTSIQRHEPRSPNGQPEHPASVNEWQEAHKKAENGAHQQAEPATEEENGEAKSPTDSRKHGTRRILRQKRANDVPKPPPIPEWFLKKNVRLFKDGEGGLRKNTGYIVRCVDTQTGHTLFTVPWYEAKAPPKQDEKKEETFQEVNGAEVSSSLNQLSDKPKSTPEDFFDSNIRTETPTNQQQQADESQLPTSDPFLVAQWYSASDANSTRWVFREAEAGIRAAFSFANDNQRTSSFASDRVDLSLQCPGLRCYNGMNKFVHSLGSIVGADVVRLDANDFADLTEDYVGQGHDELGSFSTLAYDVFDGYAESGTRPNSNRQQMEEDEEEEEDELDEDEEVPEDEQDALHGNNIGTFASIADLRKVLRDGRDQLGNAIRAKVVGIGIGFPPGQRGAFPRGTSRTSATQSSEMNRDDARLAALLDQLIDAAKQKRATKQLEDYPNHENHSLDLKPLRPRLKSVEDQADRDRRYQRDLRYRRSNPSHWLPYTAYDLVGYLDHTQQVLKGGEFQCPISLVPERRSSSDSVERAAEQRSRTIIHLPELRDLNESRLGDAIIQRLAKIVRKRRRSGEQIVLVGTTVQDVAGPYRMAGEPPDAFPFRVLTVPPFFSLNIGEDEDFRRRSTPAEFRALNSPAWRRLLEINLRNIQSMLRRLRPEDDVDLTSADAFPQLNMPYMRFISEKVLSQDEVQRLVLLAIGLSLSHAISDTVKPIHVALAGFNMTRTDQADRNWATWSQHKRAERARVESAAKKGPDDQSTEARIERLKKICNPHETRLLSGMVDAQNIKTGFADVHAPVETIEALKTLTTLSLLRPEAFKYGVLANDRLPGLLLYGPPGTGKTLLAKAVAKESKATVLEVSGAQIYEKYVGEGEKMVRAVFSLAKKLTPCVVFIDEADAIFGSRSNAGNRNTHREIINQFLREWDGMDDHGVFMMVASNRPFDLDDAVLRRLPRRLLIDLPVAKDREAILGIHLKNELLDAQVSLAKLAEQTPLYSGSDLKNLSVAAALACVREENELASSHKDDKDFELPAKRTLTEKHFEKALSEISASISEDMSSLTAVRKFDEQYGDRKGRRKRASYGFGAGGDAIDEGAARVRQPTSSSSSPPPGS